MNLIFLSFFGRKVRRGDAPRPWYDGMFTTNAVGIALYVLYIRTLYPSVPGGDSGTYIFRSLVEKL